MENRAGFRLHIFPLIRRSNSLVAYFHFSRYLALAALVASEEISPMAR